MTQPAESNAALIERTIVEMQKVIVGQDRVIERMVACVLAQGHCLLEGVPGLAKTLAAETLARVTGGTFHRLQFTPDLVPSDIVGTRIYRASSETFDIELGPIFANFVLTDEAAAAFAAFGARPIRYVLGKQTLKDEDKANLLPDEKYAGVVVVENFTGVDATKIADLWTEEVLGG